MNIFYLDKDPVVAAQMHCDKHVVKMILESAQMLSTAHRVLDGDEYANETGMYKMAHKNHPSTIWVRSSGMNYMWLYEHMRALMDEYTYRYGKHHATERLNGPLFDPPNNISWKRHKGTCFSDPPMCMPEEYKTIDVVESYRDYYINEKSSFATWKVSPTPEWFNDQRKSV